VPALTFCKRGFEKVLAVMLSTQRSPLTPLKKGGLQISKSPLYLRGVAVRGFRGINLLNGITDYLCVHGSFLSGASALKVPLLEGI
jgi:hypothetical protein